MTSSPSSFGEGDAKAAKTPLERRQRASSPALPPRLQRRRREEVCLFLLLLEKLLLLLLLRDLAGADAAAVAARGRREAIIVIAREALRSPSLYRLSSKTKKEQARKKVSSRLIVRGSRLFSPFF